MAIFSSGEHYFIGVLYSEDEGRYSGMFVKISKTSVEWVQKVLRVLRPSGATLLLLVIGLCVLKQFFINADFVTWSALACAIIAAAVIVIFLMIFPMAAASGGRKKRLIGKALACDKKTSKSMYVCCLEWSLCLLFSAYALPRGELNSIDVMIYAIYAPMMLGNIFAIYVYGKNSSD